MTGAVRVEVVSKIVLEPSDERVITISIIVLLYVIQTMAVNSALHQ
jgi:hypothetical protein